MATKTRTKSKAPSKRSSTAPPPTVPAASAAPDTRDGSGPSAFEPSLKQIAYLFTLRDALLPTGDKQAHDAAMAKKLKVSRQTIYEWKQDPAFRAWFHEQLGTEQEHHKWLLLLETHYELGIRGSVKSAEFIARARSIGIKGGGFTDQGGDTIDNSVKNYSVVLLSPRPPAMPAPALPAAPGGQS